VLTASEGILFTVLTRRNAPSVSGRSTWEATAR